MLGERSIGWLTARSAEVVLQTDCRMTGFSRLTGFGRLTVCSAGEWSVRTPQLPRIEPERSGRGMGKLFTGGPKLDFYYNRKSCSSGVNGVNYKQQNIYFYKSINFGSLSNKLSS